MSSAALQARLAALLAGQQPPPAPSDPLVLTSALNGRLAGKLDTNGSGAGLTGLGDANILLPATPDHGVQAEKLGFLTDGQGGVYLDMRTVARLRRHAAFYGVDPGKTAAQNKIALDYALAQAAATGCEMQLPDGDINTDPLAPVAGNNNFGLKLRGSPRTRLIFTGTTADCMTFGVGTIPTVNLQLEQFMVWSAANRTAGAAIRFNYVAAATLDRVSCGAGILWNNAGANAAARRLYDGFVFFGAVEVEFRTSVACGCAHEGLSVAGPANQSFGAEFRVLGHSSFSQCGRAIGIHGGMGGVYLSSGAVLFCDAGVLVDNAAGSANREVFWDKAFTVDTCTGNGFAVAQGALYTLLANGGWANGHGGSGVFIDQNQPVGGLYVLVNVCANSNGGQGLYALGGRLVVLGCSFNLNTNSGVVTGNPAGDHSLFMRASEAVGNTGYAVNVLTSATDYDIAECNLPAGGVGKVLGHTANDNRRIIRRNKGFVTEAFGQTVIASGAAGAQVAHGLDLTPVIVTGTLLSAAAQPAGANLPRVSALSATAFTYDIGVAASAATTLMWGAKA